MACTRARERCKSISAPSADVTPSRSSQARQCNAFSQSGGAQSELAHLRELPGEIRRLGETGITVTRFKGLGEMDPEELWETTLDPQKRTLLKVTLNDAQAAEDLFRKLMGEEVEGRRNFIFQHKIDNPEDIDYGA